MCVPCTIYVYEFSVLSRNMFVYAVLFIGTRFPLRQFVFTCHQWRITVTLLTSCLQVCCRCWSGWSRLSSCRRLNRQLVLDCLYRVPGCGCGRERGGTVRGRKGAGGRGRRSTMRQDSIVRRSRGNVLVVSPWVIQDSILSTGIRAGVFMKGSSMWGPIPVREGGRRQADG